MVRLKATACCSTSAASPRRLTAALGAALSDETPAMRTEAARLLREVSQQQPGVENPAYLRRLLRDRVPEVQIEAARALAILPLTLFRPSRLSRFCPLLRLGAFGYPIGASRIRR